VLVLGDIEIGVWIEGQPLGLAQFASEQRETIEGAIILERRLEDDPLAGLARLVLVLILAVILVPPLGPTIA
jgi:hypothetical protein